ncbi:MAG: hypothetical protein AAGN66_22635 [Acidobacteriota bacterium]
MPAKSKGSKSRPRGADLGSILAGIESGDACSVYLVSGDLVSAEPQATRLAEALARRAGCDVETHRRPARLAPIFADLRTYSLFSSAKVILAVDTALVADSRDAAELVDQAAAALPLPEGVGELDGSRREAASRLMQALHLFGTDPAVGQAADVVAGLPKWALQGGTAFRKKKPRGRTAKQITGLVEDLAALLEAGRASGLTGVADGDLAELGEIVRGGVPEGHCLVLAERSAAEDHPVVTALAEQGAWVRLASVSAGKGGDWQGLEGLVAELQQETGAGIARDALGELARRTLRQTGQWSSKKVDAESTARFAGEYRKLANLAAGRPIDRRLVAETVKDRGEEDVWQILDALAEGRGHEALGRYRRLVDGARDTMAARLSFFSLLAGYCRQLAAVAGMARMTGVPAGVRNYNQFKTRWAPKLQGDAPGGGKNPLAGLHPFRLHRAYLAASQIHRAALLGLPWKVLETELQVKGEASDADTAVAKLLAHLVASRAR